MSSREESYKQMEHALLDADSHAEEWRRAVRQDLAQQYSGTAAATHVEHLRVLRVQDGIYEALRAVWAVS